MSIILDVLGSAGFGSVIGGVFGFLSKREERKNLEMKFGHDLAMMQAKTQAAIESAKLTLDQTKVAGALLVEKIEAKAFEVSQKSTGAISDFVKSFIRPVILGLLMYQTYGIMDALERLTGGLDNLPVSDVVGLYRIVVLSVTGLTATAIGWYFAARSSKQFDKLLEKWHP